MKRATCLLLLVIALGGTASGQEPSSDLTDDQQARIDAALAMNQEVIALHEQGRSQAALPLAKQVLEAYRSVYGEKHPHSAAVLFNLGMLYMAVGDNAAAQSCLEQALAIRRERLGDQAPDTIESINGMAYICRQMGDFAGARRYSEQALAISRDIHGDEHPDTATCLSDLGTLFQWIEDHTAALARHEQALAIRKKVFGEKHAATAESLCAAGVSLAKLGRYADARPYLEQALAIRREILGETHPETANSFSNLGFLFDCTGDYAAAEENYRQALDIFRQVHGENHPTTATLLNNLGYLQREMGSVETARAYFEQSLAVRKRVLDGRHPDVALSLSNLATLDAACGRWTEAAASMDQNRRIARRHAARVLPSLSAKDQARFLKATDEPCFHRALSLGLLRTADPASLSLSASWLLNGKAVSQETLTLKALVARESTDPAVGSAVLELQGVRRQLAALALVATQPEQEAARRDQLAALEQQEDTLSRRIAEAHGQTFQADPWVEVDAVRNFLPADTVLVDIARFPYYKFAAQGETARWKPARYAAWLIPPTGEQHAIRIIDLGEAEKIDLAVQEVRMAMQAAIGQQGTISQQGEPEAEKTLRQPLAQLAQLVLAPLVNQIGDAQQIVLSPDADLWLVPWGTLPLADGRYAIEQYQIRYVVSGRDLVAQRNTTRKPNQPMIMADPNYDLSPAEAQATTRAVLRGTPVPGSEQSGDIGLTASASALPKFARLPYTAAEAQLIAPRLQSYADVAPAVYTGKNALEGVFKAFKRPRIAVLSTHAFSLEDQVVKHDDRLLASNDTRGIALTVDGQPIENPLLRCGLLLAGCNTSGRAQAGSGDDGVLTGMEIVGAELRGTELVVLSACETGLGQVRNGEGVAGLRQAFQLAGAQAVVATLWQVSDRESARLMTTFFDNLAAGQTKPDALRNAQLAMIQYRRDKYAAAHPFFWAAFTITGE